MASQYLILLVIVCLVRFVCTGRILPLENFETPDGVFAMSALGLSIEEPDGWYRITDDDELNSLFQTATRPLFSNNKRLISDILNLTSDNLTPLFGISEYQLGTQNVKFNPNIIRLVTKLTNEEAKENECDTFIRSNKFLQVTQLTITDISGCTDVNFNEKTFFSQILHLNVNNMNIRQTQYVRRVTNNYFLTFTLSYSDEISKTQLDNIMNTLKFRDE
ncbi:unnamed protein product [Adineta steineri]|uniref:Uncharacterized protein n=1 Tax=Adineta steineri TaxID=433720 RepID=A0A815PCF7_9BILA|nr:unnamed protein product [Adineta steineri]CAF1490226.1 unnamed protein product [Adineta steineri]CAF3922560.1 unnamed protein product [Adineta steineri]CAF4103524.1 unnamed protein product [Adineta steineri]